MEFPELLGWGPTPDTDEPIEHPLTNRMIGGVRVGDTEEYVFFDRNLQQSWHAILRAASSVMCTRG